MQLTLDVEEFNVLMMIYIKSIVHQEVDHKTSLRKEIKSMGVPEAELLFEEREQEMSNGRWDSDREKLFNKQLHKMVPQISMQKIQEFDEFIDMLSNRNMDNWLRQRFFRQNPKMRLALKRFIDRLHSNDDIKVRLIV